jgi:hypothetical protein
MNPAMLELSPAVAAPEPSTAQLLRYWLVLVLMGGYGSPTTILCR